MARRRSPRSRAVPQRSQRSPWPTGPVPTSLSTVELTTDNADPDGVLVLLDGVESSHLDLADPRRLMFEYMQQMLAALEESLPEGGGVRALHLGAAGCALARAVDATWPESRQLAVEVDALLAQYVRDWFDLPRSPLLRIRVDDARRTTTTARTDSYDAVIRDAFADRSVPAHLRTVEFTREVARVLAPGGLYLANTADHPPLPLARREAATVAEVFEHTAVIAEPGVLKGRRYGNVVLVGSAEPLPLAHLDRRVRTLPAPASLVHGSAFDVFVGTSRPFTDPPPAVEAGPAPEATKAEGDGPTQVSAAVDHSS
ncbi:spermidine synthase [Occultella gossypii]|uniref:Fused MFS/spermidine synthase n=1 Tax=Occultella gossypii TaxID=2800820 RepID=A0ABS7SG94_9MICO|nr:fused MFS/spermidine synthase [Occultella gossypii]MBZ2199237.1 fused MFS/spermidine synthase [Occultella gossypii]